MPDVSLPPVGELVQITTVDGWTAVGCRTGHLPWVHAVGRPPVKCEDIASWCPVLVVPDTDETRRQVATFLARTPDLPFDSMTVMAAVRGAAIR